jgi:PAS domain S-box-containing protein
MKFTNKIQENLPQNVLKYGFHDLFEIEELQELQDSFSDLVGVASVITLLDGTFVTKPSNFCSLCNLIRSTDQGMTNCIKSDMQLSQMSVVSEKGHVQPCLSAGLWDAGVSIVVDGVHLANWMIGQVKCEGVSLEFVTEYAELIGLDVNKAIAAYMEVPELSKEKLSKATDFLHSLIGQITQKALLKQMYSQQQSCNEVSQKALFTLEKDHSRLINNINHGVVVCDNQGKIILFNAAAYGIFGLEASKIENLNVMTTRVRMFDESGHELSKENFPIYQILQEGITIENHIAGVSLDDADITWIRFSGTPLFDPVGNIYEIVFSFENITHEKLNIDKVVKSVNYLEEIQRMALIGTYTTQLKDKIWSGSVLMHEILGLQYKDVHRVEETMEVIHPDWRGEFNMLLRQAIHQKKTSLSVTYKIIKKNTGEERWVTDNAVLVFDVDGEAQMIIGTVQDITRIKVAEETALKSEQKYQRIFENVTDIYYKVDMNHIIREVSPSIHHYTSLPRESFVGMNTDLFFSSPDDKDKLLKMMNETGSVSDFNLKIRLEDKELFLSVSSTFTYDSSGKPLYYEGFIRDITYRKRIEDMLRQSEAKFRKYIEFAPLAIMICNKDAVFDEINPAASRITGFTPEELLGMRVHKVFAESCIHRLEQHIDKAGKYGLASDELEVFTKSGVLKYVIVDTVKIPNGRFLTFANDISYRKKIENSLKQTNFFLKEAQSLANVGNAVIDFKTGRWESSEMLDKIVGLEDGYNKSIEKWLDIIHPDCIDYLRNLFMDILSKQAQMIDSEFRIIRVNDRAVRWLHVRGKFEYSEHGELEVLNFTLQDITGQREWTDLLYRNEALYRTTLNASPDAIVVIDLDSKVKVASPSALQIYGSESLSDIEGRSIFDFLDKSELSRVNVNLERMFDKYLGSIEYLMLRANGNTFPAEVNGDVIRDSKGNPTGLVFIIRDMTERKASESKLAESKEQLREFAGHLQSIREEEKIALAREIHDDLGQILVAMKMDLGMLKNKMSNSNVIVPQSVVKEELSKLFELTNRTIAIARRIMSELRTDAFNNLGFVEAAKLYVENFKERYKIHCDFDTNVDSVNLSQNQTVAMYRILQESLSNIVKHAKASNVNVNLSKRDDEIHFEIIDNGCGFDINNSGRVDSFGLVGMRERVALLSGDFSIDSKLGEGTRISIIIPEKITD